MATSIQPEAQHYAVAGDISLNNQAGSLLSFLWLTPVAEGTAVTGALPGAGVLNVVSGFDALGPLMSEHPGIDKISFAGSIQTGRVVMASAAGNLKRLILELSAETTRPSSWPMPIST